MRVLIVDDNPITADALTAFLSKKGHEATFAGNGLAALTRLAAPSEALPDVIFLDWIMPGMDGEELLTYLAECEAYRQIPVILATAAGPEALIHLRQRWPKVYTLAKPFDPDELLTVLTKIEAKSISQSF